MESEDSLLCSRQPAICAYYEPDKSSARHAIPSYFSKIYFTVIFPYIYAHAHTQNMWNYGSVYLNLSFFRQKTNILDLRLGR